MQGEDVVCVPSLYPSFALSLAPLAGSWACCRTDIFLVETEGLAQGSGSGSRQA